MVKLGLFVSLITVVTLGVATMFSLADAADPPPPCTRKVFKTKMIKEACIGTPGKPGGQADAKAAMRKFVAEHKIAQCAECHATLEPTYKLKDTGFKRYQELGGK